MTAITGGWGPFPTRPFGRIGTRVTATWRVTVALVAVACAYHYSLATLVRNLGLDSPLAYLGLVPFVALVMAGVRGRAVHTEPNIHDRQFDYIVGVPMIVAAVAIVYLLPVRMSTQFWAWRMDLLSLPLFVAGTVSITFGVRALWRVRAAVGFLLLAWPLPFTMVLDRWLERFTAGTVGALKALVRVVAVAEPVTGSDGSLFSIAHGSERFVVSVASACSGANGMVGFVLVGAAFVSLVKGRRLPKMAWLLSGMAMLWAVNLVRIMLVFWVGATWGERAAIDGFHPYIGLVLFNVGVLVMILAMPLFRLRFRWSAREAKEAPKASEPADVAEAPARRLAVPKARVGLAVVLVAGLLLAVGNSGLRQFELVAGDLGEPRLVAFSDVQGHPAGWSVAQSDSFAWGTRFFGDGSSWKRFSYFATPNATGSPFRSTAPVIADVISTSDLHTFSVYGLEACYTFHGYKIRDARSVDIGGGIAASAVSYYNPQLKSDWTTLYWHVPVRTAAGTRYERVVLMMINAADATMTSPPLSPSLSRRLGLSLDNASRGRPRDGVDKRLADTRQFLVGFAQSVVQNQAALSPDIDAGSTLAKGN